MAFIQWNEDTIPSGYDYDTATWINWFKGFYQRVEDNCVTVGMEKIYTTFDPNNFELPAMNTNTSNSVTNICNTIFKLPVGTGETVFELDQSGDYYNIVSNDWDNTELYIRIYARFAKANANVALTTRYQREEFIMMIQVGYGYNAETNALTNTTEYYIPRWYDVGTTTKYDSGTMSFSSNHCIISLTENDLYMKFLGRRAKYNGGSSYYVYSFPLAELALYRENGNVYVPFLNTSLPTSGSQTRRYLNNMHHRFTYSGTVYSTTFTVWQEQLFKTAFDYNGDINYKTFDFKFQNYDIDDHKGYITLPNIVQIHSSHINTPELQLIVPYKNHKIKKKFIVFNNDTESGFSVLNNNTTQSASTTNIFAYGI